VRDAVKDLHDFVKSAGKMQRPLLNPTIILTNDIYDRYPLVSKDVDGLLKGEIVDLLDYLEK